MEALFVVVLSRCTLIHGYIAVNSSNSVRIKLEKLRSIIHYSLSELMLT